MKHGRIQRAVIEVTMDVPATVHDLARIIYPSDHVTEAQLASIRRALRTLAAQKIVKAHGFSKGGVQCWRFDDTNVDRNGERRQKLRAKERIARKPRLVSG